MEKAGRIFISHGHNELLQLKLKDFISSRLQRTPVILAELPNWGATVVEKLERESKSCSMAIVLMTKDDEQRDGGVRARQNVIHEIGFFQGIYGRKNVILLAEKGVELFSNISGIVRIEFDSQSFEAVFEQLRREIEVNATQPQYLQVVDDMLKTPSCPNCSTTEKRIYLSPIPPDFVKIQNATHECTTCGYLKSIGPA